ncbi:flagellar motor switch protein FliN [Rhodospirillum centenum]|uniref:Flagellar motor switch protein FliN n=1 Tax=Rhodospirillum centenum (strain ATCC 51521 / SW) TaxID=414684 RepID=B6IW97_RHOCS|nr:flagellar motor switch protein FliN [Rhodospirillum centenum]ACJ00571.1 flagellar motor switch protein FliN [Rhodospirillum centenum SW]
MAATNSDAAESGETPERNSILSVPVQVSVRLGRRRMRISQLLRLGPSDVVDLERMVGEPVDLFVNDRLVARGELVVVDGRLGLTIVELMPQASRGREPLGPGPGE